MKSDKPLRLKTFLLILVIVVAAPLGNVLLGKGMKHIGPVTAWPPEALFHVGLRVLASGTIWLGVLSLSAFFLAYMLVLSWADYSYVQPSSSFSYAVVAVLGYLLLGETVSPMGWAGILIICMGVLVAGRTSPQTSTQIGTQTRTPAQAHTSGPQIQESTVGQPSMREPGRSPANLA
jgi:uncharacterized membrane protein